MKYARDLLNTAPLVVAPELLVPDLARLLLDHRADGACVVDQGRLVGVVTSMDLIYQEKRVHLPSFVTIMELVVPLGVRRAEHELEKISGRTVRDIMSAQPRTVTRDAPIAVVASLMVDRHITIVPVVDGDRLVGVITKPAVLAAAFGRSPDGAGLG